MTVGNWMKSSRMVSQRSNRRVKEVGRIRAACASCFLLVVVALESTGY